MTSLQLRFHGLMHQSLYSDIEFSLLFLSLSLLYQEMFFLDSLLHGDFFSLQNTDQCRERIYRDALGAHGPRTH